MCFSETLNKTFRTRNITQYKRFKFQKEEKVNKCFCTQNYTKFVRNIVKCKAQQNMDTMGSTHPHIITLIGMGDVMYTMHTTLLCFVYTTCSEDLLLNLDLCASNYCRK